MPIIGLSLGFETDEQLQIKLNEIKTNIKSMFATKPSRKWTEMDIYGDIKVGDPAKEKNRLVFLLANIFALCVIMNSDLCKKEEEKEIIQHSYLHNPYTT